LPDRTPLDGFHIVILAVLLSPRGTNGTLYSTFYVQYRPNCNNTTPRSAHEIRSGIPRGVVWGVQTPPEIPKISVKSSIA